MNSLYSHVHALDPAPSANGVEGHVMFQEKASKTLKHICERIKLKETSGDLYQLLGQTSSSKTCLMRALEAELGDRFPFVQTTASALRYLGSDLEATLVKLFRRTIGVRLREAKELYEGEVMSMSTPSTEPEVQEHFEVVLRTGVGSKKVILDGYSAVQFREQRVALGDVVLIEVGAGTVRRLGRCDVYTTEFDLEAENYVPLPKEEVYRRKLGVKDVTLAEIDRATLEAHTEVVPAEALSSFFSNVLNKFETNAPLLDSASAKFSESFPPANNSRSFRAEDLGAHSGTDRNVEAPMIRSAKEDERFLSRGLQVAQPSETLREQIDQTVMFYESRGNAQVSPGVLCIWEAHRLSEKEASVLLTLLETIEWAPTILLVSSRSPEALPECLRSRALCFMTEENSVEEIFSITMNTLAAKGVSDSWTDEDRKSWEPKIRGWCKDSGSVSYVIQRVLIEARLKERGMGSDKANHILKSGKECVREFFKE